MTTVLETQLRAEIAERIAALRLICSERIREALTIPEVSKYLKCISVTASGMWDEFGSECHKKTNLPVQSIEMMFTVDGYNVLISIEHSYSQEFDHNTNNTQIVISGSGLVKPIRGLIESNYWFHAPCLHSDEHDEEMDEALATIERKFPHHSASIIRCMKQIEKNLELLGFHF